MTDNQFYIDKLNARIEALEAALQDAVVLLESTPQPTAGLVGNSVQADFNKRLAAVRAALSGGAARSSLPKGPSVNSQDQS